MTSTVNILQLNNFLNDSGNAFGDIIRVGINDAVVTANLLRGGIRLSKLVMDCDVASLNLKYDNNKFCFAFVNINDSTTIKSALDFLWPRMSYGATLFFSSYNDRGIAPVDKLIKKFIISHKGNIAVARQKIINGIRERGLAVKCFCPDKKPPNILLNEKVTIATVLKLGGSYDVSYVNHIANSIKEYVTTPYEFVCLTDCFSGFGPNVHKIIPFNHDFPKWWGKIELFAPDMFNTARVFYLDLDTIIIDNIDNIVQYGGNFFGLRDFYNQHGLGSGLMCWNHSDPIIQQIYEQFMESPDTHMGNCRFGDQEFIANVVPKYVEYVQDLYPNQIVSYKKDCVNNNGTITIPKNARIICFHGLPRPHQINNPDITKHWRG